MSDLQDLRRISESWPVPPGDLKAVEARAQSLRWRRRLGAGALVLAIGAGVVAVTSVWPETSDSTRIVPAGSTTEGARAATLAFHALRRLTDYKSNLGPFDYQTVDQVGEGTWRVTFLGGADPEQLRGLVKSRSMMIGPAKKRNPNSNSRSRQKLLEELRGYKKQLRRIDKAGGVPNIVITVQSDGSYLVITETRGPLSSTENSRLLQYREEIGEIQTTGYERHDIRTKLQANGWEIDASEWWTGPIPSSYKESCQFHLVDSDGKVVFKPRGGRYEAEAPSDEGHRDWGTGLGFGVAKRFRDPEYRPIMDCGRLQGDGWRAVGDARLEPVTSEFAPGSNLKLDPKSHIMVATKVVYDGEPDIESICIAHVFDEQGAEIDSHGLTLTTTPDPGTIVNDEIQIPADVGDPDRADYATVDCQPTVPGVSLGPDQTP